MSNTDHLVGNVKSVYTRVKNQLNKKGFRKLEDKPNMLHTFETLVYQYPNYGRANQITVTPEPAQGGLIDVKIQVVDPLAGPLISYWIRPNTINRMNNSQYVNNIIQDAMDKMNMIVDESKN